MDGPPFVSDARATTHTLIAVAVALVTRFRFLQLLLAVRLLGGGGRHNDVCPCCEGWCYSGVIAAAVALYICCGWWQGKGCDGCAAYQRDGVGLGEEG